MTRAKKQKQRRRSKIIKTIDAIQTAASTAMKMYRAVEPIAKAILKHWRRTK